MEASFKSEVGWLELVLLYIRILSLDAEKRKLKKKIKEMKVWKVPLDKVNPGSHYSSVALYKMTTQYAPKSSNPLIWMS